MPATETQKDAVAHYLHVVQALAETIREVGEAPEGVLYAGVMNVVADLSVFQGMIQRLIGTGLVERRGSHLLVWVGPN